MVDNYKHEYSCVMALTQFLLYWLMALQWFVQIQPTATSPEAGYWIQLGKLTNLIFSPCQKGHNGVFSNVCGYLYILKYTGSCESFSVIYKA